MNPARLPGDWSLRVRRAEPMSKHTSWHVGGPADIYFEPRNADDLAAFLRSLPAELPVTWLGLGSNLLVRDGGIRGAVIATQGALDRIDRVSETRVYCEAGVPCARLAKLCIKWGLGPAEFFGGIPGTFGGALAMNAGAFGGETWRHVVEVDMIARDGRRLHADAGGIQHWLSQGGGTCERVVPRRATRVRTRRRAPAMTSCVSSSPDARKPSRSVNGAAARYSPILRAITLRV